MRQASLEQDGVHAELCVQQRHVAVHLHEEVDALVALVEVRVVVREGLRAAGTAKSPAGCYLTDTKTVVALYLTSVFSISLMCLKYPSDTR